MQVASELLRRQIRAMGAKKLFLELIIRTLIDTNALYLEQT